MTDPARGEVGGRIRSGVLWKGVSQVTLQVARLAVALVLARLLVPEDWGLAAMVLLFTGFGVVFTDSALGTALVQRRTIDELDRSTVFWTNAGVGLVLALVGVACAGPLAAFYGEPEVRPLFVAVSIGFLVTSLGTTHLALLTREMSFRRLELRQIAATAAGAAIALTLALAGHGPWAIVGLSLGEAAASTALLWLLTPWRPRFVFSRAVLRRLAGFAGNVFGENVVYQAGRSLPPLLIGRVLGPAALGAFTLATTAILVPFARLAAPLQQVFFPAFARLADERDRIAELWIGAARLVALVAAPALVGLAVVATDLVDVVLGSDWAAVAPLVQILAVVGLVQALQTLNGEVLLALGRAGTLFRFTLLWAAATVAAVAVGLAWGLEGAAACYAAAVVLVEPVRTVVTTRALGIPARAFVLPLAGVAQAAALLGAALLLARALLLDAGIGPGARLALLVPLGALLYAGVAWWRARDVVAELGRGVRGRRGATPAASPV